MRKILLLLLLVIFLPGCFITITPSLVPAPPNNNDDEEETHYRSPLASESPMPEWVKRIYWTDGDFMYAVGITREKEAKDFDVRLRMAEFDAVATILKINKLSKARLTGKLRMETWISPGGTTFMLVRTDRFTNNNIE